MELNTPKMRHEEMIDTLKGLVFGTFDRTTVKEREALDMAIEALEQEPRKGHWIRVAKDKLRCSECDLIHFIAQYPQGKIAWCPNCGAKMVEPQESEDKE